MTPPPINIDGTTENYSNVTIDGQDVEQITIDGQDVLSAIPDSDLLQARYDATELSLSDQDDVTTWPDETDNNRNLDEGGTPIYETDVINGNPAVYTDGDDDYLATTWSEISAPNYVYAVFQKLNPTSRNETLLDSFSSSRSEFRQSGGGTWRMEGSDLIDDGGTDSDNHILVAIFDGANSSMRLDGSEVVSGDVGSTSYDGFQIGESSVGGQHGEYYIGEILVYYSEPSTSDVESYLSDKWGVSLS